VFPASNQRLREILTISIVLFHFTCALRVSRLPAYFATLKISDMWLSGPPRTFRKNLSQRPV
jgi:hypothetical protein